MAGAVLESLSREHYVYLAKLSEQSKRYDDMVSFMQKLVKSTPASELSLEENLPASHPVRLGLALNLSVFYYEILNQRDKACDMAIQAFVEANNAAGELVKLGEEYYKESKLTMQLLRDNIFLWTPYLQEKDLHPLDFC